jgi:hypothetical protein
VRQIIPLRVKEHLGAVYRPCFNIRWASIGNTDKFKVSLQFRIAFALFLNSTFAISANVTSNGFKPSREFRFPFGCGTLGRVYKALDRRVMEGAVVLNVLSIGDASVPNVLALDAPSRDALKPAPKLGERLRRAERGTSYQ